MAAAGVPDYVDDQSGARRRCGARDARVGRALQCEAGMALGVRVGLHCGPVIAGIHRDRQFAYDLWGETVNTASRMESHGSSGRIQLSESAALHLKRTHEIEERGRGRGEGRRPDADVLAGRAQGRSP